MKVVQWAEPAIDDLRNIDDYWSAYSEAAAIDVADRIERAASFLIDYPEAGPVLRSGIRKWRVPATRYIVVYRLRENGPEVLRVYHSSQDRSEP